MFQDFLLTSLMMTATVAIESTFFSDNFLTISRFFEGMLLSW